MKKKQLNKHQDKQGSFAKMALVLILLFLLFWKDKVKEWFCPCECETTPDQEKEEPFFSPDFNPEMQKQEKEVNKELFERQNDSNILDLSKAEITQRFFPDTDTVKLTSVFK
jgi:hypothetical protein